MKIIKSCEPVKPALDLKKFEDSLKPGDVFYRKADLGTQNVDGLIIFMRVTPIVGQSRYVNLVIGSSFENLNSDKEYFLAPDAALVLNIKG